MEKKMVLKSVDPMALARVLAVMGVIWGLIYTILYLVMGTTLEAYTGRFYQGFMMIGAGTFGVILLPIYYGVIGFVAGYVGALIYNYVVKFVGGVKIELK